MTARARIVEETQAAGFTELLPAHLAVFQHPGPHGRSPGQIAHAANASKQAMNNLLAQLERAGYLSRRVSLENRRERTVELTDRGHAAIAAIRVAVSHLEQEWRAGLGSGDYEQLRTLLQRLNDKLAAE